MKNNVEVDNIKQGIIYSLEKRGVLDNLKAYLRSDIYSKLKENSDFKAKSSDQLSSLSVNLKAKLKDYDYDKIKVQKLSISLISDFMKKNNLNYALSVFLPESQNLIVDELYNETELSKICQISFEDLDKNAETSFLNYFVKKLTSKNDKEFKSIEIQTENHQGQKDYISLDEKLKAIDNKYNNISLESLLPAKTLEEKMLKMQRELESRFKSDLEREVQRVKEVEISQLRIEENRKYMKKIDEVREEYEKEYREKLESLKRRESDNTIRMNLKEKELETQLYENRQKFLTELELIKRKEEELKRKYENDYNNLKLEEEKLNFKQKEVDYIKESSIKKIKEETEQFKLQYDRLFENEKKEMHNKKLVLEEKEFKISLFEEKLAKFENENKFLLGEKSNLHDEIKNLEKLNNTIKKDNEMLREELKILANNEKRNADMLSRSEIENQHLRDETRLLRESLSEQKKMSEDRKNDQSSIINNLKKQLDENTERYEKSKQSFDFEIERMKKYYLNLIESEKEINENRIKSLEKKIKVLEVQCRKYKENISQISKRGEDAPYSYLRVDPNNFGGSIKLNNYFNNLNDIKATDRLMSWSKLEKEADDIKTELKRSFAVSSKRTDKPIQPSLRSQQIDQIYNDIYEKFENEKMKEIKEVKDVKELNEKREIKAPKEVKQTKNMVEEFDNLNKINYQKQVKQENIQSDNNTKIKKEELQIINNNYLKTIASVDNLESGNSITDKSDVKFNNQENKNTIPVVNDYFNTIRSDENIMNFLYNSDSKRDNFITKFEVSDNKKENDKFTESNNTNKEKKVTFDEGRNLLEKELNKIKDDYNKKLQNEKPTPIIISAVNNQSIRSNRSNKSTNNNNYDKQDSNNDFSIANLTSSNEWELESHRKETNPNKSSQGNLFNVNKQLLPSPIIPSTKIEATIISTFDMKKEEPQQINKSNFNTKEKEGNTYLVKSKENNTPIKEESDESLSNFVEKEKKNSLNESNNDYNKNSFNKFSNVNIDLDKNEIEEDIKDGQESENYDYDDFVDDVDAVEKKMSVDLDAFKNASLNFNNSVRNVTNNNVTNNNSKSYYKSQSIDRNIEKILGSKSASNIEENIIEDISYGETSKKELPNSAKSNTIEEDSALKYNDYIQSNTMMNNPASSSYNNIIRNVLKDSSIKEASIRESIKDSQRLHESRTSEIKEEIIPDEYEEDGYEPVIHNDDYY